MGLKFHSYLTTGGEVKKLSEHPGASTQLGAGNVPVKRVANTDPSASLPYFAELCQWSERVGYDSILIPISSAGGEDPVVTSMAMMPYTTTLKMMSAFRPSLLSPVVFAQMVTTIQKYSGNRLTLNVTPGIPGLVSQKWGAWLDKQELLDQAGEFLTIMKGAWDGPFDYEGKYFRVRGASVPRPEVLPRIFYAGSSELSMRFAAKYADVYMSYVEPYDMVKDRLERAQNMAADEGRTLDLALSLGLTARETSEEAWAVARGRLDGVDTSPAALERSLATLAAQGWSNSGARQRLIGALNGDLSNLVIGPNLWVGEMVIRGGTGPGMVGSYDEIADRVEELYALGVRELLCGGGPGIEGRQRFAEKILPKFAERGLLDDEPAVAGVA